MAEETLKASKANGALTSEPVADEMGVVASTGNQIAKAESPKFGMVMADLDSGDLPDMSDYETAPIDFIGEYWTPETVGETRDVFFSHVERASIVDEKSGEIKELPTAHFAYRKPDGSITNIRNASARLVAGLQNAGVTRGMGLTIEYLGKIKNKTNAFLSDNWRVSPKVKRLKPA